MRFLIVNSKDIYLVVVKGNIDEIQTPDDRGIVNSFISVGWKGQLKRTETQ